MSDEEFVTGPQRVDRPQPELVDGLAELWGRVALAGHAIGFAPTDPVEQVREAADAVVADVGERRSYLLTLGRAHVLVGAVLLTPSPSLIKRHTGELSWLMVDPELAGQGWDQQLHDAAIGQAFALGLEAVRTYVPGDPDVEQFYVGNGWVERGRWPDALRVTEEDERAEVWFTRLV